MGQTAAAAAPNPHEVIGWAPAAARLHAYHVAARATAVQSECTQKHDVGVHVHAASLVQHEESQEVGLVVWKEGRPVPEATEGIPDLRLKTAT